MYTAGPEKKDLFLPIVTTFLGDTPQAQCAANKMQGPAFLMSAPCWSCAAFGNLLNTLQVFEKLCFKDLLARIQHWNKVMMTGTDTKEVQQEARSKSMYIMEVCPLLFLNLQIANNILKSVLMRLWYFNCAVNITTCTVHYLDGGNGKNLVNHLPEMIEDVWPQKKADVRRYIETNFARAAETRFPELIHFRNGIFGKHIERTRRGEDEGETRERRERDEGEARERRGRGEGEARERRGRGEGEARERRGRGEGEARERRGRGEGEARERRGRGEGEVRTHNYTSGLHITAGKDFLRILELLPYILHGAMIEFPAPNAERLLTLFTLYMMSMYLFLLFFDSLLTQIQ